jgi:hypothetical protein
LAAFVLCAQGENFYEMTKDNFYQVLWRPRPASLLNSEEKKKVRCVLMTTNSFIHTRYETLLLYKYYIYSLEVCVCWCCGAHAPPPTELRGEGEGALLEYTLFSLCNWCVCVQWLRAPRTMSLQTVHALWCQRPTSLLRSDKKTRCARV